MTKTQKSSQTKKKNRTFKKKLEEKINKRLIKLNLDINNLQQINSINSQFVKIDAVVINDNIYELISKNYFKTYFQIKISKLKKNLIRKIKPQDSLTRWIKNIYVKNL